MLQFRSFSTLVFFGEIKQQGCPDDLTENDDIYLSTKTILFCCFAKETLQSEFTGGDFAPVAQTCDS